VAEGGSLIVASEVPSAGAFQLDLRFWGEGTSLMRSGWRFFRRLASTTAQPFSPAVVIKSGRLRPQTG